MFHYGIPYVSTFIGQNPDSGHRMNMASKRCGRNSNPCAPEQPRLEVLVPMLVFPNRWALDLRVFLMNFQNVNKGVIWLNVYSIQKTILSSGLSIFLSFGFKMISGLENAGCGK